MVVGPFRQSMKAIALPMVLLMLTATLAGCAGSDPDGGDGTDGIDMETLNQLIEDNLEDFLNNTSVTVNQDFHYYNNTTTINENTDNSVSNINGSGVGSASTMQMFRVNWNREVSIIGYDVFNHIINFEGSNQIGNNSSTFAAWVYNGNLVEFTGLTCTEWYGYYMWSGEQWNDWLYENYGSADDNSVDGYHIENHFNNRYNYNDELFEQCGIGTAYANYNSNVIHLFDIELQHGQALSFSWLPNGIIVDINCDDGYRTGMGNGTSSSEGAYHGGQANCTVTGSISKGQIGWSMEYDYQRDEEGRYLYDSDGDGIGDTNNSDYGDIVPEYYIYFSYSTPESTFSVYFLIHNVEVYDLDSE